MPPDHSHTEAVQALLRVCTLLNRHGAKYLVAGGYACILHGMVRTTEDVDILIDESTDNYRRVIDALSEMEDHAARDLTLQDFEDNVVIKVADEVEVDISRRAWKVSYTEAAPHARHVDISGVTVPYLSLRDLIASKETYREQDRADLARLRMLADVEGGKSTA
jgi:uncharacterized protein (DUF1330 family)